MMYMKKNKAFWPYLVRKNTYIREYDLFKSRLAHHRRRRLHSLRRLFLLFDAQVVCADDIFDRKNKIL